MRVTSTLFQNGRGHLAGAVMITSGAIGNITKVRSPDSTSLQQFHSTAHACTLPAPFFAHRHVRNHLDRNALYVMQSTFKGNQVAINGAFGGAIFHDFCDKDKRAKSDRSFFTANTFLDNKSAGFGGAIRIGSPQVRLVSVATKMGLSGFGRIGSRR
jgi:predicted outer membrane repeat protein